MEIDFVNWFVEGDYVVVTVWWSDDFFDLTCGKVINEELYLLRIDETWYVVLYSGDSSICFTEPVEGADPLF